MKTQILSLVALTLLVSCGRSDAKPSKVKVRIQEKVTTSQACKRFPLLSDLSDTFKSDHDIKLYRRTIDLVLNEIGEKRPNGKKYRASKFWETLSEKTRLVLNHEVIEQSRKLHVADERELMGAVAVYFSSIRKRFTLTDEYKVRTANMTIYAFSIRAQVIDHTTILGLGCLEKGAELDFVTLPDSLFYSSDYKSEIHCRVKDQPLTLSMVKDQVLLYAGKQLYVAPVSAYGDDTKRKVRTVTLKTPELSLNLAMSTSARVSVGNFSGAQTAIALKTLSFALKGPGACQN